ncbi:hypothetical protein HOY80DRAFT_968526 [Tuber brumale]|nr:hypothetical protein HOY80DRAFT_968526 [Tuber brumale]
MKMVERLVRPRQPGWAAMLPLVDFVFALLKQTGGEVVAILPLYLSNIFLHGPVMFIVIVGESLQQQRGRGYPAPRIVWNHGVKVTELGGGLQKQEPFLYNFN